MISRTKCLGMMSWDLLRSVHPMTSGPLPRGTACSDQPELPPDQTAGSRGADLFGPPPGLRLRGEASTTSGNTAARALQRLVDLVDDEAEQILGVVAPECPPEMPGGGWRHNRRHWQNWRIGGSVPVSPSSVPSSPPHCPNRRSDSGVH